MNNFLLITLTCLVVPLVAYRNGCMGNGCGGNYDFKMCVTPVCQSGKYTGLFCTRGHCPYVCYGAGCQGSAGGRGALGNYGNRDLYAGWGYGGYGQNGCVGGNCGYWMGCPRSKCAGFYDFRRCMTPACGYGAYRGYGCSMGNCQYICLQGQCHSAYGYGHGCDGDRCGISNNQRDYYAGNYEEDDDEDDDDDENEDEKIKKDDDKESD